MSTKGRYPSDLTDTQWVLVDPLLSATKGGGRPETHPRREVVNAILYVVRTGCSWRQLPKDYPPWATVYWHFARWRKDGSLDRLHDALRDRVRRAEGRSERPSAAIIDAQSVKGAATVGASSRGFDAGKKVNGRKRHVVVDTIGLLLLVMVTTASVQDRDGARPVLEAMSTAFPAVTLVWADGGYAGKLVEWAKAAARIVLEIVKKPEGQRGFEVLPRRWVVERTLSWITGCRRLDRDYERLPATSEAMIKWAMIGLMTRRLAPGSDRRPWTTPATT
ncbi:MAG: IS5 family transposase [Actinobacteria bacterium]|nr:IS5 family transposase [Actinomycetota bacterium]